MITSSTARAVRRARGLRRGVVATLAVSLVAALAACGTSDPTAQPSTGTGSSGGGGAALTIGSQAFPESELVAEIYAQALEAKGMKVTRKFNIGPRQQTIPALRDGSINLMPEYNGNLLGFYDKTATAKTTADIDTALTTAIAKDKLRVLDPSPGEDKDAYVVTSKTASDKGLTTIADLSKIVPFTLGANPQFTEFDYGIPGLKKDYGVGTKSGDVTFKPIEDYGGPDTVKALTDNTVQVADIYTTSPAIKTNNLVVLQDPKQIIAAQNILPLVAESAYSDQLASTLNAVSAKLTTDELIALRTKVEVDQQNSATAAKDWLKAQGLVS